jgi:hypothetical protein
MKTKTKIIVGFGAIFAIIGILLIYVMIIIHGRVGEPLSTPPPPAIKFAPSHLSPIPAPPHYGMAGVRSEEKGMKEKEPEKEKEKEKEPEKNEAGRTAYKSDKVAAGNLFAERMAPSQRSAIPASPKPGPAPAQGDGRGAIDRILEKLEFGNIAFNAPTKMNLQNTAIIQLLLGSKPADELKRMIEAEGEKEAARIRVSDRMEARLSGPNFAITAITPEIQAVSRSDVTEWKWEVKPNSIGRQYLHLAISVHLIVDGVDTPRVVEPEFDKLIEVEVTGRQRVDSFFNNNWQWLWTAILIPIAAWLWKRWRTKKGPKSNASKSDS